MTSRSEFDAELRALRASLDHGARSGVTADSAMGARPESGPESGPGPEPGPGRFGAAQQARTGSPTAPLLEALLAEGGHGIKTMEEIWDRLNAELDDLPRDKPFLTAMAALGVGYLLGRLQK